MNMQPRSSIGEGLAIDLLVILIFGFLAFFFRLGALPIVLWDEAREAINALEMHRSGDLLITTYRGWPDLWNTKPPLVIWLEAASFDLFGVSELALRIPSAVAAMLTTVIVYGFARSVSASRYVGLLSALVLMATPGFVGEHVARTGDYDSVLVLFYTATVVAVWMAVRTSEAVSGRWILLAAVALALAVMAKGIAGMFVAPGVVLFLIFDRKLLAVLRTPATWLGVIIVLAPIMTFLALREAHGRGFLAAMAGNDLGGRFMHQSDGSHRPWWFYGKALLNPWLFQRIGPFPKGGSGFPWVVIAPLCGWVVLRARSETMRRASLLCLLSICAHMAILTVSKTRQYWYIAPIYPLIAIIVAFAAERLWSDDRLRRWSPPQTVWRFATLGLAAIVALAVVWRNSAIIDQAPNLRLSTGADYVRRILRAQPNLRDVRIVSNGYDGLPYSGPEEFYAALFHRRDVQVVPLSYKPLPGETVLWCDSTVPNPPQFTGKLIDHTQHCSTMQIVHP